MNKPYILFPINFAGSVFMLNSDDCTAFTHAVLLHHTDGTEAAHKALNGHREAELIFNSIEPLFNENRSKYNEKCKKNAENGALGGQANKGKKKGKKATEDSGESDDEDSDAGETPASWKSAGWKAVLAASWTQDNLMVARGVWFTNVCPWIEKLCQDEIAHLPEGGHQDLANACGAYVDDVIVPAVRREAQLAPLAQQASGRHPHDLGKWLRSRRWTDKTYSDATWAQTLADAQGRAAQGGNHSSSMSPGMSPGEQTIRNIMQGMAMPERDAVDVAVQEEDDGNADSDAQ